MTVIISLINWAQDLLEKILEAVGFIGPLLLRLYLVPIFWIAGTKKIGSMESTIEWFGNPEWGLGLPFPTLMAWMASLIGANGPVVRLTTRRVLAFLAGLLAVMGAPQAVWRTALTTYFPMISHSRLTGVSGPAL